MNTNIVEINSLLQEPLHKSTDWMAAVVDDQKNKRRNNLAGAIAMRLLAFRRDKGFNNQQLAIHLGVSPQYIGRVLKGKENLSLDTIAKLEEKTGVKLMIIPKPPKQKLITRSVSLHTHMHTLVKQPQFTLSNFEGTNQYFVQSA